MHSSGPCLSVRCLTELHEVAPVVQEVRFVDLNDEAIAALQEAVQAQGQGPAGSLTLLGAAADCAAAMQDMQHHIQVWPPAFKRLPDFYTEYRNAAFVFQKSLMHWLYHCFSQCPCHCCSRPASCLLQRRRELLLLSSSELQPCVFEHAAMACPSTAHAALGCFGYLNQGILVQRKNLYRHAIMLQDSMVTVRKNLLNFLSKQAREEMLRHAALMPLHCQLSGDCLTLKGCKELVDQVTSPTLPFPNKISASPYHLDLALTPHHPS